MIFLLSLIGSRGRGSEEEEHEGIVETSRCGQRIYTNDVRTHGDAHSVLYNRSHIHLVATLRNKTAFQIKHAALVTSQLLVSVKGDMQAEMTTDCLKVACRNKRADQHGGNLMVPKGGDGQTQRLLRLTFVGREHCTL